MQDKFFVRRMLEWSVTKAQLEKYDQDLVKVQHKLGNTSALATGAIVSKVEEARTALLGGLKDLQAKYKVKTPEELMAIPEAREEMAKVRPELAKSNDACSQLLTYHCFHMLRSWPRTRQQTLS